MLTMPSSCAQVRHSSACSGLKARRPIATASQNAGTTRQNLRHRYGTVSGPAFPENSAVAHGRYSSRPDSTKKIATPMSPWPMNLGIADIPDVSPVSPATCSTTTVNAAAARMPSRES
ncbi:hypothetical protein EDD29_7184 [Actinocorallia herbida]|uniref:Uncharacterized protein n=1 Tax=Actinocorallia herbida TaxID=58109 RepID=A0A3N1D7H1_9ACTN|nr:hypothetical protein EDD29_7184 [Actinocorallia herbida]